MKKIFILYIIKYTVISKELKWYAQLFERKKTLQITLIIIITSIILSTVKDFAYLMKTFSEETSVVKMYWLN